MSNIEIRAINDEEMPAWSQAMARTFFLAGVSGEAMANFRRSRMLPGDLDRMVGAFDGGSVVGTFRSFAIGMTMPGGGVQSVAAVTNVAVLPTHRRRGILSGMMARDLRQDAERGESAAILIASEYPIYGRYGYGAATEHATWTFDRAGTRFEIPLDADAARIEHVTSAEAGTILPEVFDRYRLAQPGEIVRRPKRWLVDLGIEQMPDEPSKPTWVMIHRDPAGTADGFVRYRVEDHYEERLPAAVVIVEELIATNAAAEAALWRFVFDIDLASTIRAMDRRVNEPVVWRLADARAAHLKVRADFLWIRPLDVRRLLEGRSYSAAGSLVVEIVDPAGFAAGRYALDASLDGARCVATDRSPQLRMPASSLGSIVLGGWSPVLLAAAGRIDVLDAAALPNAAALFHSPVEPFCSTWF